MKIGSCIGWYWLALVGIGWYWLGYWLELVDIGWYWLVLVGIGWYRIQNLMMNLNDI